MQKRMCCRPTTTSSDSDSSNTSVTPAHAPLPRRALIEMIIGAALISTTSIFVKLAHVGPTMSGFYRMAIGGVLLLLGLIALRRWQHVPLKTFLWLLIPGIAFAIDLMMWHRSILYIGPGLATLLGNMQVFLMALAGFVLYCEALGRHFILGLLLSFAGLVLLIGLDWQHVGAQYRLGVLLAVATAFFYAIYMLSTRHSQRSGRIALHPAQLLCVSSLISAIALGFASLVEGESFAIPDAQTWSALIGLALFGQVLGWVFLTRAMPQLPASVIGLLMLLQPALSFLLDVILFSRPTTILDWLGLALALAGIFIGSRRRPLPAAEPVA